jgi:hypothetical protein
MHILLLIRKSFLMEHIRLTVRDLTSVSQARLFGTPWLLWDCHTLLKRRSEPYLTLCSNGLAERDSPDPTCIRYMGSASILPLVQRG